MYFLSVYLKNENEAEKIKREIYKHLQTTDCISDNMSIIVVGGDGTLLKTLRQFNNYKIRSVYAVNYGSVGALILNPKEKLNEIILKLKQDQLKNLKRNDETTNKNKVLMRDQPFLKSKILDEDTPSGENILLKEKLISDVNKLLEGNKISKENKLLEKNQALNDNKLPKKDSPCDKNTLYVQNNTDLAETDNPSDFSYIRRKRLHIDGFGYFLNEVLITNKDPGKLNKYDIFINNEFYITLNCDSVLICTPSGSSGYNLSAGGPFLDNSCEAYVINAVSSFRKMFGSMVVDIKSTARVVFQGNGVVVIDGCETYSTSEIFVSYDGDSVPFGYLKDNESANKKIFRKVFDNAC